MVYGPLLLFTSFELIVFCLYRYSHPISTDCSPEAQTPHQTTTISIKLLIIDGLLLVISLLIATIIKRGGLKFEPEHIEVMVILFSLWLLISLSSRKFSRYTFASHYRALSSSIKTTTMIAAGLTVILYGLRLNTLSRIQILGALLLYMTLESVVFYLYVSWRKYSSSPQDIEDSTEARNLTQSETSNDFILRDFSGHAVEPVKQKLQHALEFFDFEIFTFIDNNLNLDGIERRECDLLSTDELSLRLSNLKDRV